MNCPSDGTTLLMSERQGIEIDYCPECRGIWLDRGELDKILERTQAEAQTFTAAAPTAPAAPHTDPTSPSAYGYPEARREFRDDRDYRDERAYRDNRGDRRDDYRDRRDGYGDQRSRKKRSPFDFLGEIFD